MPALLLLFAMFGQLYGDSPEERAARIVADSNERIIDSQERIADQARRDANPDPFDRAMNRLQGKAESPQRIYVQNEPQQPLQVTPKFSPLGIGQPEWITIIAVTSAAVFIAYRFKAQSKPAPPASS